MKGRNFAEEINGKPVINGKRRITLHVSPRDTIATPRHPGDCAAARAAVREIPNCIDARIHLGRCYVYDSKRQVWQRYKTSDSLRTEVCAFDKGGKFEPGEYDMIPLAPSDLDRSNYKYPKAKRHAGGSGERSTNQHKKPRRLHVVKGVRHRATIHKIFAKTKAKTAKAKSKKAA